MTKEPLPQANKPFYRALEDRHRGSRELIKQRLRVYLPFIDAAAAQHPGLPVLDAGCGRGEWLELLKDHHLPASGVDTDPDMLAACAGMGLIVHQADVLVHLQTCPDQSLLAVTGFHIAEHLPFAQLQDLFAQAWRVLVSGGLLILETPNPENLLVGAANFYIDPTHQRPLPAQLLSFLAEHQGFAPVKLLRLQEEPRLTQTHEVNLYDVLGNVSPDYAIIAQTPLAVERGNGSAAELNAAETGVSLFALASRYDQNLQQHLERLQTQTTEQLQSLHAVQNRTERALMQNEQLSVAQQQLAAQYQQLIAAQQQLDIQQQQLNAAQQQLTAQYQQLSDAQQQLAAQQAAVYASLSWRITAPLRWLSRHLGLRAGRRKP